MPVVELNAFSARMAALQAQESLQLSNIIGVGTGSMKKTDSDKVTRGWRRDSGATAAFRKAARANAKAAGKSLPIVGIGRG